MIFLEITLIVEKIHSGGGFAKIRVGDMPLSLPPLYKYMDLRGARLTLKNQTFKHSKPADFNDLEDLTVQSLFPEDIPKAINQITNEIIDIIVENINIPPALDAPMRAAIVVMQQSFRLRPESIELVRKDLLAEGPILNTETLKATAESVIASFNAILQDTRVLCVTTHRNSEKMWEEYAGKHNGICIRIVRAVQRSLQSTV